MLMGMSDAITEIHRRLDNLICRGTVAEVDHASHACRVQTGELLTDWLPWMAVRAGKTRTWCPPTVGEQVVVFCPSGETGTGFVLTGLYSDQSPPPSASPDLHVRSWPDGGVESYDHSGSTYLLSVPGTGSITLVCGGSSMTMDKDGVRINGKRIDLN